MCTMHWVLICWPDPLLREVCWLLGVWVKNVSEKLPSLMKPTDCYPLLMLHVEADTAGSASPSKIDLESWDRSAWRKQVCTETSQQLSSI